MPIPLYLNNVVVSWPELIGHVSLALSDRVCVRQDARLLTQFGGQHFLHHGLVLNRRYNPTPVRYAADPGAASAASSSMFCEA